MAIARQKFPEHSQKKELFLRRREPFIALILIVAVI
jgi:hypothetical protein